MTDTHTTLLAAALPTAMMLNPDDPKAAVDLANRILDQIEIYDQERFTRPLAAELDEDIGQMHDDLLPDPGDMVPVQDPADMTSGDDMRARNDRLLIERLGVDSARLYESIDNLYYAVLIDSKADTFEHIQMIRYHAKRLSAIHAFRHSRLMEWPKRIWSHDDINTFLNGIHNPKPDAV